MITVVSNSSSESALELSILFPKKHKGLPPVWLQRVSWRGETAAPSPSFPPPPCVYTSHLQPQDTCHLRHGKTGRWWGNIYTYTFLKDGMNVSNQTALLAKPKQQLRLVTAGLSRFGFLNMEKKSFFLWVFSVIFTTFSILKRVDRFPVCCSTDRV